MKLVNVFIVSSLRLTLAKSFSLMDDLGNFADVLVNREQVSYVCRSNRRHNRPEFDPMLSELYRPTLCVSLSSPIYSCFNRTHTC